MSPAGRRVALALAATLALSPVGYEALKVHEGDRSRVYLDVVGIPTVCMGTTEGLTRADVGKLMGDDVCKKRNLASVATAEKAVRGAVKVPLTQDQFDALVSFTFNVGGTAMSRSTLIRLLNSGNCKAAAAQFSRWNQAGGKAWAGLTKRRAQERALFEKDC